MIDFLKRLFCSHEWAIEYDVNGKGLCKCYCEKCHKKALKSTHGDIEN